MKVRTGFVSNSSSTAFIIQLKDVTKQQLEEAQEKVAYLRWSGSMDFDKHDGYDPGDSEFYAITYERNEDWASEAYSKVTSILTQLGIKFETDEW